MVVCKDSLWVKVCKAKYGVLEVLSTLSQNTKSSIWWKDMLKSSAYQMLWEGGAAGSKEDCFEEIWKLKIPRKFAVFAWRPSCRDMQG